MHDLALAVRLATESGKVLHWYTKVVSSIFDDMARQLEGGLTNIHQEVSVVTMPLNNIPLHIALQGPHIQYLHIG